MAKGPSVDGGGLKTRKPPPCGALRPSHWETPKKAERLGLRLLSAPHPQGKSRVGALPPEAGEWDGRHRRPHSCREGEKSLNLPSMKTALPVCPYVHVGSQQAVPRVLEPGQGPVAGTRPEECWWRMGHVCLLLEEVSRVLSVRGPSSQPMVSGGHPAL